MFFGGELGEHEGLQGGGLGAGREVEGADFGDVAEHVVFHGGEGHGAEEVCCWRWGRLDGLGGGALRGERGLPKRVVSDSAASRKSEVGIALLLEASMGTLTKDFLRVSNQVPPGGKEAGVVAMAGGERGQWIGMPFCGDVYVELEGAARGCTAAMDRDDESGDWLGNSRSSSSLSVYDYVSQANT